MKFLALISFVFITGFSFSQNTMRFSQLNFGKGINNPAALALDGKIMADMMFRNQWLGVDGAPTSLALNAQYEVDQDMAVGLNVYHDRIGVNQNTSLAGQYAYRVRFDGNRFFALGAGIGIDNQISSLGSTVTTMPGDPLFSTSYAKVFFNASLGVYYRSPRFYIGASIPQLFQNSIGAERGFKPPRWHYYLSTGFYLHVGEKFTFNPHIQLKAAVHTPLQGDLILRNTIMGRFSFVVGYRSENSIIAGFDVLISEYVRAGYSFNHDVGKLARTKGMSNELYLGLAFPYRKENEEFGDRRYISNKGGHRSDFKKNSTRKHRKRGRRFGRKTKYR
jgi:type IX secretion system PorP/SprF family membrane protein